MQESSFAACLTTLEESGSEFILVGGLAAVLQGAPVQTYDIDVVYSRATENVERVLAVLHSIDAIFRIQPERRLRPNASHIQGAGHLNLLTRYGPLDLLATVGDGLTYEDLLPHSRRTLITESVRIHVLDLDFIIALKEQLGSEKDSAVLPTLRQTAREIRRQRGELEDG
jgi:hypothetical protein